MTFPSLISGGVIQYHQTPKPWLRVWDDWLAILMAAYTA